jgi:hypothetical protein
MASKTPILHPSRKHNFPTAGRPFLEPHFRLLKAPVGAVVPGSATISHWEICSKSVVVRVKYGWAVLVLVWSYLHCPYTYVHDFPLLIKKVIILHNKILSSIVDFFFLNFFLNNNFTWSKFIIYIVYFSKKMTDTLCLFQEMFFYNGDCSFGMITYDLIILPYGSF